MGGCWGRALKRLINRSLNLMVGTNGNTPKMKPNASKIKGWFPRVTKENGENLFSPIDGGLGA